VDGEKTLPRSGAQTVKFHPAIPSQLSWWCIMCFEFDCLIVGSGGSRANGSANGRYGSCYLSTRDDRKQAVCLDLSAATNNEVECWTRAARIVKENENSPGGAQLRCS
jgi:hypothetical protein